MRAILVIIGSTIVVAALTAWYIFSLAQWSTATVTAAATASHEVTLAIDTVAEAGAGPHPDWVSYQTADFDAHQSAAIFKVPVNTWVTVIVHQYDGATPLRNPFFGLVQGTRDGVAYWNGKPFKALSPDVPSHTFAIPDLGINVPLPAVPDNATGNNPFETVKFTFFSGTVKHSYRWQCFVPCGWGADGNGGPMATFGFMGGLLVVG